MRVAKFCAQNVKNTTAGDAMNLLKQDHSGEVSVMVFDCLNRCLACRTKPFCKIQLSVIEANDAEALAEHVLQTVQVT